METDKLIEALRCCGIHIGDKNCGECPVCATEEIKCPELMALAADKLGELNDFEKTPCARLLVKLAEKDKQLAAAVELQQSILEQTENLDGVTNYGDGPVDADEALCRLNLIARMIHGHRDCFSGLQEVIAAWNRYSPLPDNKALMLEELRGMDGQPVWVVSPFPTIPTGWWLLHRNHDRTIDLCGADRVVHEDVWRHCRSPLLFYRRPPESEERHEV